MLCLFTIVATTRHEQYRSGEISSFVSSPLQIFRANGSMLIIPLCALIFASASSLASAADEFEDYRCKCVCPSFTVLQDPSVNDTGRRVYVDVVPPDNCTCQRVVFHTIPASKNFQERFCPRYAILSPDTLHMYRR